jgi:RNA polymerase sigma factor (sigma-70 family)
VIFTEYVAAHQRGLLRFATAMTTDEAQAEDVVQDVLTRAYQRWDAIAALEHPHAYIRRMIVNAYLSWRRRWARVTPYADVEPDAVRDHADQHADRAGLMAEIARLPRSSLIARENSLTSCCRDSTRLPLVISCR